MRSVLRDTIRSNRESYETGTHAPRFSFFLSPAGQYHHHKRGGCLKERSKVWRLLCAVLLVATGVTALSERPAKLSVITIHVEKSGIFSAFAHHHTVIA